ncbi:hypothetical protein PZ892_07295 [Sphingobacterium sp. WM]|uniref:hypothetical protein n=1 Tax=Sphingobacterium sp. WM TaxID=3031802 RepID=UPI00240D74C3|nr:hypothetical protein [Sphingobacterium sp. WM]WFB65011.1 hypothetical protein PZ892_07295 [Sphingobacterium sp. WM]
MDNNNLENTLISLNNTIEALQRELLNVAPVIDELIKKNTSLSKELESEMQRLIKVIDVREKSLVDFVKFLQPFILTIEQYKNFTPIIDDAIDEGVKKIELAEKSLINSVRQIPTKTLIHNKHSLDYKSMSVVAILSIITCIALFSFGQIWLINHQLNRAKSYEMRYRMIGLELPHVAKSIDSLYTIDSERFDSKVIKREEEQRLKWSVLQKQRELIELDKQ